MGTGDTAAPPQQHQLPSLCPPAPSPARRLTHKAKLVGEHLEEAVAVHGKKDGEVHGQAAPDEEVVDSCPEPCVQPDLGRAGEVMGKLETGQARGQALWGLGQAPGSKDTFLASNPGPSTLHDPDLQLHPLSLEMQPLLGWGMEACQQLKQSSLTPPLPPGAQPTCTLTTMTREVATVTAKDW